MFKYVHVFTVRLHIIVIPTGSPTKKKKKIKIIR